MIKYSVEKRESRRRLGVHTSIAGGLHLGLLRAWELGCTAVQIFSHNPRSWETPSISEDEAARFRRLREELDIRPVFVHASYLVNIASAREEVRARSVSLLAEEMSRANAIGADFVVLHAGNARDGRGRMRAAQGLRKVLGGRKNESGLLIENTPGRRGDIASTASELAELLEGARGLVRGVCVDTCHAYAAGHDLAAEDGARAFFEEIRVRLGTGSVRLFHLNDARGGLGSGLDRHEHLGKGRIGGRGLRRFVNHPDWNEVPVILETPKEGPRDDPENLRRARRMLCETALRQGTDVRRK